jgi:hypothetical protein
MTFAAVLFLGVNRGETSRLWIYLAVLFPIPASLLIARTPRSPLLFVFVGSTLVIQSIVALQTVNFVLPDDCEYQNVPGFEAKTAALKTFLGKLKVCAATGSAIRKLPQCMGLPWEGRALQLTLGPLRLNGVAISGAAEPGDGNTFRAGDLVGITTHWTLLQDTRPLKFSLRLHDSGGRQWMQRDYWPQLSWVACRISESWRRGETIADRQGMRLPPDLPPGRYQVSLVVYDPETGAAVLAGEKPSAKLAEIKVVGAAPPPEADSLDIPVRLDVPLSEELALIGYDVEPDPLRPESDGMLRVWWTALRPLTQPYQVQLELIDGDGHSVFSSLQPISIAPPNTWQEGQIVAERYPIALDPEVVSSDYRLRFSLVASGGAASTYSAEVGAVRVLSRSRTYDLPSVEHLLHMKLGQEIALRGYTLDRAVGAANELRLTLYWQALERVSRRYKVFVHVVDDSGRVVAQQDSDPGAGAAPTQTWLSGEIVTDAHVLNVPSGGPYELLTGLYDPESGERLPVSDEAQQPVPDSVILLERIQIP